MTRGLARDELHSARAAAAYLFIVTETETPAVAISPGEHVSYSTAASERMVATRRHLIHRATRKTLAHRRPRLKVRNRRREKNTKRKKKTEHQEFLPM